MTNQDEQLRQGLRAMWSSVAVGWGEYADFTDTRGAGVTERLLERTAPRAGERVLELACGPGGVGLSAAERVGPDGEVVLSDVSAEMTAIAAARAASRGLGNVKTRQLDLERIDVPDGSFDVVLCRDGLMLVPDPALATSEIRRVLRRGGRAAVAVWGPRASNPWLGRLFDAVSAQVGHPVPPPGIPGPFSLAESGALGRILAGAGLSGVEVSELPLPYRVAAFDDLWRRTTAIAGPVATILASLPPPAVTAVRSRFHEAMRRYETATGLNVPGLTLIASGHRDG